MSCAGALPAPPGILWEPQCCETARAIPSSGKTKAKTDRVLSLSFALACSYPNGSPADKQGIQSLTAGLLKSDSILALLGCFLQSQPLRKKEERKEHGQVYSPLCSILQLCVMTFTNAGHIFLSRRSME